MKRVLCYGDSNTYGLNPVDETRLPHDQRWTGILADRLGREYEIIEEGLCARTTVRDYPEISWGNGLTCLTPCLLSHRPLDLVILMLGTNDMQLLFNTIPLTVAHGAEALVQRFRTIDWSPERTPQLLLVSPIHVGDISAHPVIGPLFGYERATQMSHQLAPYYREIADRLGCHFFDAASVASPSPVDGLHMDPPEHEKLACALEKKVREICE